MASDETPERYWRVAVPVPLRRCFDYRYDAPLAPGQRVLVPFAGRQLVGIVVGPATAVPQRATKVISELLDDEPLLDPGLLALLHWVARYYHHPIGEALALGFPSRMRRNMPLRPQRIEAWRACPDFDPDRLARAPAQRRALECFDAALVSTRHLAERGIKRSVLLALERRGAIQRTEISPRALPALRDAELPPLSAEQRAALEVIGSERTFSVTLLEGITGSGKTEVYLRLLARLLGDGDGQALVLVPEIGLTPQTVARFEARFNHVALSHSSIPPARRAAVWESARRGEARVLIGTRSAVFTPMPRLRVIVVDEEHDASFKQHDGIRYSARDVAIKRARELGIPVLLGSATPSFESLANALSGRYRHARLTRRPGQARPPAIHLVDLRGAAAEAGVAESLSRRMRSHLEAGGQVLVYLNRRGYAPVLHCTECGWVAECPNCDLRLTLHRRPPGLRCHHCDHRAPAPRACPACGSPGPETIGSGTQRIEAHLAESLGDVPILRIDRDSTRSLATMSANLERIASGEPLVLVGTQMLAKGHHFPGVSLVVILNADAGLFSADFRGPERMAQTVIQVSGRAGRAERPGEVYLQTFHPEHPLIRSFQAGDYAAFARASLAERRQAGLPPFAYLALIRAEGGEPTPPSALLRDVRDATAGHARGVRVLGPVPAPVERLATQHRFQLLVHASRRGPLHELLEHVARWLESHARHNVRWSLDVDPLDVF